jgi:hypothetical protein
VEHFKQLLAEENQKQGGAQKAVEAEDSDEGLGDLDMVGAAVADVFD